MSKEIWSDYLTMEELNFKRNEKIKKLKKNIKYLERKERRLEK